MMQRRIWASHTAAPASLVCAVALLHVLVDPVRAHEVAPVGAKANAAVTPVPQVAGNRWGPDYFPNLPLTTQDGATVRLYDDLLKGKSVAINVIYTSCKDECPLETVRVAQLQKILGDRVGKDIFFYSITIDPERDTPKVLKAYAKQFGAGPGWLFLTGKPEDIKLITRKLGLGKGREINRDDHSANLMVGNEPTGQWMRNSALDNPRFLAVTIGNFLGWKDVMPAKSYAEAQPLVLDRGQYLFESLCSSCHTVGKGDKMGPDLLGVTARRTRDWLTRYLLAPDQVLAAGDPIATALYAKYKSVMPNLRLASEDAAALLSYLETQSSSPRKQARKDSVSVR